MDLVGSFTRRHAQLISSMLTVTLGACESSVAGGHLSVCGIAIRSPRASLCCFDRGFFSRAGKRDFLDRTHHEHIHL